jgi:hypothetical protein
MGMLNDEAFLHPTGHVDISLVIGQMQAHAQMRK